MSSQVQNPSVLHVGKYYPPVKGGIEDHLSNLCNDLRHSFTVKVLVANDCPETVEEEIQGVSVIRVFKAGEFENIPVCPTMPLWLMRMNADIVHLHLPNPMAHLAWFLVRPKGRLVVTYHSDIIGRKAFMRFYTPFLMYLLRRASAVITGSPPMVKYSPFLSRLAERITVIPYGVNLSRFDHTDNIRTKLLDIRRRYGDRIVLFVGRLTYYKGVEYLLQAMEGVDANLIIVGKGKLEDRFRQSTAASQAMGRIHFVGEIADEEILAYFHACDVFVLPSVEQSEVFGIVQLEAMACGKPVVSTNLSTGVPWVNQDGKSGIVVAPRDPKSLASAINKLLGNPELRNAYGKYGRERVEKEFTHQLVAERVSQVYRNILGMPG